MSDEKTETLPVATDGGAVALLQQATAQGAGIEVIERMAALYREERADKRRTAYYSALADFQADCPKIERADEAHNSKYAKLERIVSTIREALKASGLTYRYEIADEADKLRVTCIVTHSDGHSESASMTAPADTSGNKSAIQSRASTVTYLERYTLCGALGIVTADEDNDGNGGPAEVVTGAQANILVDMIAEGGSTTAKLLAYGKVDRIDDFPAALYKDAVAGMKKRIARKGAK